MHTTKKMTHTQAMQTLNATEHEVTRQQASEMVKQYKGFRNKMAKARKSGETQKDIPIMPVCLTYQRDAILNLMKTPGCAAVRMYFGINKDQQLGLVIVGVDETGKNILDEMDSNRRGVAGLVARAALTTITLLDEGQASPPYPRPVNDL